MERKTQTYTKINTLYKRYQGLGKAELPDKKWIVFQNKIIIGDFSDDYMEYIRELEFDCFSKIDGTNSKIVYFPSTGECFCGGKTDKAEIDKTGQRKMLDEIIARIKPTLAEMFPASTAKFTPAVDDNNKVKYLNKDFFGEQVEPDKEDIYGVMLEEVPVYIYGEFFGKNIQKGGNYDKDKNRFYIFDVCQQGWWVPVNTLNEYAEKLGLEVAPYLGKMNIREAEQMVMDGFTTHVPDVSNPNYPEEGIVARPAVPIKDPRGRRIIVKIKTCDYADLQRSIAQVGQDSYEEFKKWYNDNRETIEATVKG